MTLTLTVLGCDGGYAGPGGACSGYLVRGGGMAIYLDAGPGTLSRLQQHVDIAELTAVVVSHEHPDHSSDLEGLAVALRFDHPGRVLPVYAPASVRAGVYDDYQTLEWVAASDGDRVAHGPMELRFSRTDHGPETLALRVDLDGASFGYSADSGPEWSLEALGHGLDLALCEATWTAAQEGRAQHMSARQAASSARAAGSAALVLTHRWPTIPAAAIAEEGTEAFGAPVAQASAGASYSVGRKRAGGADGSTGAG